MVFGVLGVVGIFVFGLVIGRLSVLPVSHTSHYRQGLIDGVDLARGAIERTARRYTSLTVDDVTEALKNIEEGMR